MDRLVSADTAVFHCASQQGFLEQADSIAAHLSRRGYAIVEAWDVDYSTVIKVAERFGCIQTHIRADAHGIVGINPHAVATHNRDNGCRQYDKNSIENFLPHTDGSYLQGLVRHGDGYIHLLPPQMIVLQFWQPPINDEAILLIDAQRILDDLAERDPQLLETLSTNGCINFCRDDQVAVNCAVFEALGDGTIMLRFRYDSTVFVAEWAREALDTLQRDYLSDPRYQIRATLRQGQIVVIDNYRMLHGHVSLTADAQSPLQTLRRVWLARSYLPVVHNAAGQHVDHRVLKRSHGYRILPPSPEYATSRLTRLGIRVGG
jgi:alpha-ketoglutarate-dependent taurine dioxygenase